MTIDYRHNHTLGINPIASRAGVSASYREWGIGQPGRLAPVQAVSSSTAILTQVADWPWSEDDIGVPFDQANLWGVRTCCMLDGGGGEVDWWVAVPKTLPVGYTPVGRHGRIVPFIDDHIGVDPFNGRWRDNYGLEPWPVRWRTPTGQYPTDLTDDGYLWTPMNLNQQSFEPDNPIFNWYVDFTTTPYTYWAKSSFGPHVGYRGIKLDMSYPPIVPPSTAAPAGTWTFMLGCTDVDAGDPTTIDDVDILWEEDVTFFDGDYIYEGDFSPGIGDRKMYHWIIRRVSNPGGFSSGGMKLSPRTDIPLWYWASTRNRVAPGGVIV